jgi:phosphatidylinositol alpha-1,6-mannosyltransferase
MQRVASQLYNELQKHDDVELSSHLLRSSWRWIHVKVVPYLLNTGWQLYRKAQNREMDLVLFSSMVTAALAVPLQKAFRRNGIATAAIVHGLDVTLPFGPYQWFVPKVFDALDAVLPVSQATGAACRERGLSAEKLHVVPNGIDLARFPPTDEKRVMRRELKIALDDPAHPLPDDALLCCSVGRQVERKGFAWFVDHVMPKLPPNVHYWMGGDGPEAEAIQAAIDRNGLNGRVRRLGYISEEDLAALYRGSDLYIMPNVPVDGDMEGFGIVMLEAGLCGTPVIAAQLEGIRDVVTEGVNGHLVAPQDAEAFADAIRHYRDDRSALRAMAEHAEHHVKETFSWSSIADQYVQTLQPLVSEPAAASN